MTAAEVAQYLRVHSSALYRLIRRGQIPFFKIGSDLLVCGAVPVVDDQYRPVCFLTDRDICMGGYTQGKPLAELQAGGAMARKLVCCRADDDLDSAAQLMRQNHTRRLPVIDREGILVGLLSLDDLECEAARSLRGGKNHNLRDPLLEVHLSINRGRIRLHQAV